MGQGVNASGLNVLSSVSGSMNLRVCESASVRVTLDIIVVTH